MSKTKARPTLSEVLKAAIEESGLSYYRLSRDTGVVETSILRFMRGETSLRLDKADRLAAYLGLRLTPDPEAVPPKPTPDNLTRPMLAKRTPKRKAK